MKQNKKTEPTQESKNILKPLKPLLVYRRKLSDNSNLGSFRDVKRQTMSEQSNKPEFKVLKFYKLFSNFLFLY